MSGTLDENPYEAPSKVGDRATVSRRGNRSWLIVMVSCIFLLLNLAILAVSKSSLADLLIEFDIQLSVASSFAYAMAKDWMVMVATLLIFSVGTTFVYSKLKATGHRFVSVFLMVVISIWMLFSLGFGFGILQPLYVVVTGLTD